MKTEICLNGLFFYAHHGHNKHEEENGSRFRVDLTVSLSLDEAIRSDDLADTLNYQKLYDIIKHEMAQRSKLIEHLAGRIFRAVKSRFPETRIEELKVTKMEPPLKGPVEAVSIVLSDE